MAVRLLLQALQLSQRDLNHHVCPLLFPGVFHSIKLQTLPLRGDDAEETQRKNLAWGFIGMFLLFPTFGEHLAVRYFGLNFQRNLVHLHINVSRYPHVCFTQP